MLDMGFMPEIQKMVEDPNMPKKVRFVGFGSAQVVRLAIQNFNLTLYYPSLLGYLDISGLCGHYLVMFFCNYSTLTRHLKASVKH